MNGNQTNPQKFWPRRVSWLTIVLTLLAIISFVATSRPGIQYITPMGGGIGVMEDAGIGFSGAVSPTNVGMPMMDSEVPRAPFNRGDVDLSYPYPIPSVPINDTREFLKLNYNASMRTRDVQDLTRRVETTVRGYGGRIDQESSSPQYSHVSFVVPQSRFNVFREELEGLVGHRFLTISISSQNLLPQKQSIEEQQKQADATLADYKTARQKLVSVHISTVAPLQEKIDADTQLLTTLRSQAQTPQVLEQIQIVSNDLSSLTEQLTNENASYVTRLKNADRNIKYAEDWQKAVQTQDQILLDNIATVTGTVSIQWISFWDIIRLYLPGYWIPAVFLVLAFLSLLNDRRRFGTV